MTGQDHIRRLNELKAKRRPLEPFWQEAYKYTYPLRGEKFGNDSISAESQRAAANDKNARIYDSTAKDAVRLLAASLMSGLTPANSKWFGLEIHNLDEDQAAKEWLDGAAETIWRNIHASNYDVAAFESFIDLACSGMFAMYITEGAKDSSQPYNFQQWPLHSCYCVDSTGKGMIETIYRVFTLTAEQAIAEYGEKVSEQIKKAVEKKPDTTFDFVQAIYPRKNPKTLELPIASEHIEVKSKKTIRISGYHEMPVVVPRWLVIPDSVYSVGPVDDALPDIKTVNEVVKLVLSNADMAIAGMCGAVDDGVVNTKSVKVGPRKVIAVASKDSFFPLNPGTKFDIAVLEIERLQTAIRKLLMADQLQPQDGPAMTATEVHIRTQLVRQLLGPMYGRLQVEFLQPLIARCFGIVFRAEALSKPPEKIEGKTSVIRYASPLAKAQKLEDIGAIERFETGLYAKAQAGTPEVLDIYDLDKAERRKADLLGVPADLLRDEDAVKKLRDERKAALAQQQKEMQEHEMKKAVAPKIAQKGAA